MGLFCVRSDLKRFFTEWREFLVDHRTFHKQLLINFIENRKQMSEHVEQVKATLEAAKEQILAAVNTLGSKVDELQATVAAGGNAEAALQEIKNHVEQFKANVTDGLQATTEGFLAEPPPVEPPVE